MLLLSDIHVVLFLDSKPACCRPCYDHNMMHADHCIL